MIGEIITARETDKQAINETKHFAASVPALLAYRSPRPSVG